MGKCTACGDSTLLPNIFPPMLKYNEKYCSHLCAKYHDPFINREPAHQAPQNPLEIRIRIEKWLRWIDMNPEEMNSFIQKAWETERQNRREWVAMVNHMHEKHRKDLVLMEREHNIIETHKQHKYGEIYNKKRFQAPAFQEPTYKTNLPFPVNILPEPISDWSRKEFQRTNPKCDRGYIHLEAANGGAFQDCEVVHPRQLERGAVLFHAEPEKQKKSLKPTAVITTNMLQQTY